MAILWVCVVSLANHAAANSSADPEGRSRLAPSWMLGTEVGPATLGPSSAAVAEAAAKAEFQERGPWAGRILMSCLLVAAELVRRSWLLQGEVEDRIRARAVPEPSREPTAPQELQARLKQILSNYDPESLRAHFGNELAVDMSIAGGGNKSLYSLGAIFALQHAGFRIERFSGASFGAYCAAAFGVLDTTIDNFPEELLLTNKDIAEALTACRTPIVAGAVETAMNVLEKCLEGRVPPPNTIFVSLTAITLGGLRQQIVGTFHSSEDFLQAVRASMAIPFIGSFGAFQWWRGQPSADGGVMNNAPVRVFAENQPPGGSARSRITVVCDGLRTTSGSKWWKLHNVLYSPWQATCSIIIAGMCDMLQVLVEGKTRHSGITVVTPVTAQQRPRRVSYQFLPCRDHILHVQQAFLEFIGT